MKQSSIWIPSFDGFLLSATLFENEAKENGPICLFTCATGVKQGYYYDFCRYLANISRAVLIFDYRGVGSSLHHLNNDDINTKQKDEKYRVACLQELSQTTIGNHWAKDANQVLNYFICLYPNLELIYIGHSVGGHLLGYLDWHLITRILFLSVNSAYYKYLKQPGSSFFYPFAVIQSLVKGYFPASSLGLGEDLPSGVGKQWAYWGRFPEYMRHNLKTLTLFDKVKLPISTLFFSDDELVTINGMKWVAKLYPNADNHLYLISGLKVGHLGYFKHPELWFIINEYITNGSSLKFNNLDYQTLKAKL